MTFNVSLSIIYLFLMDKTNKITITCPDWYTRMDIADKVASLLKINVLDMDDYIIRGSVLNGDIEEYSKDSFVGQYGQTMFDMLEQLGYRAYVNGVEEPFVISIGNDRNEGNINLMSKTISINVRLDGRKGLSSKITDYSILKSKSTNSTAKEIVKLVTSDERWSRNL